MARRFPSLLPALRLAAVGGGSLLTSWLLDASAVAAQPTSSITRIVTTQPSTVAPAAHRHEGPGHMAARAMRRRTILPIMHDPSTGWLPLPQRARATAWVRGAAGRRRSTTAEEVIATVAEQQAYSQFRRLQRAGLSTPAALAALSPDQRAQVCAYQRKSERRARARRQVTRAWPVDDAPPGPRRPGPKPGRPTALSSTAAQQAAVRSLRAALAQTMDADAARRTLSAAQYALVQSYDATMRRRARQRGASPR